MNKALIFIESHSTSLGDQKQVIKPVSLELFSLVKTIDAKPIAFVATHHNEDHDQITKVLSGYGVEKIIFYNDPSLTYYNPEILSEVMQKIIKETNTDLILASGTSTAKDLFPRVAALVDASFANDAIDLGIKDGTLWVRKPLYAGKCSARLDLKRKIKIAVMRPHQFPVLEPHSTDQPQVQQIEPLNISSKIVFKKTVQSDMKRPDLTQANIIVSGGRGLQKAENFKLLEELADVIGASVGASRAVVDDGWVDHSMQVGQTGKTVSPHLYIAFGISGAIQHLAGMSSSRVIVAINKNAEAPIFKKATYGICGDALEILPLITKAFRLVH